MASWEEVRSFMRNNYVVNDESEDGSVLTLIFDDGGKRTQLMHVALSGEWILMASPFAKVGHVTHAQALDSAEMFGARIIGDTHYLVHYQLLATVDTDEMKKPMGMLAFQADQIELRLLGTDQL